MRGFIGRVLGDAGLVWLVFSSGYPWYRGGVEGWAGRSGRLDIVARVAAAVCREGVVVAAVLRGLGVLLLPCRRGGFVDEVDAGRAVLDGLSGGLFYAGVGGGELLAALKGYGFRVVVLREGCRFSARLPEGRVAAVIGADVDPPGWVEGIADDCISVGRVSYLASVVAAYYSMLYGLD